MLLRTIAYSLILGKPLIMYMGILTLLSFLFTASIAILNEKFNIHIIPFKWHPRMAAISIILAIIHGLLGISAYYSLF